MAKINPVKETALAQDLQSIVSKYSLEIIAPKGTSYYAVRAPFEQVRRALELEGREDLIPCLSERSTFITSIKASVLGMRPEELGTLLGLPEISMRVRKPVEELVVARPTTKRAEALGFATQVRDLLNTFIDNF
jgi:hypothetical protein